eukprot:5251599-Amphidinium_carterae.1
MPTTAATPGLNAVLVLGRCESRELRPWVTHDSSCDMPKESVGFLVHPKSPVKRLLVDHPTGSGKTREMIKVDQNCCPELADAKLQSHIVQVCRVLLLCNSGLSGLREVLDNYFFDSRPKIPIFPKDQRVL